jgi:hypothetical protein
MGKALTAKETGPLFSSEKLENFEGWRGGIFWGIGVSSITLVFNLCITIYYTLKSERSENGELVARIRSGGCSHNNVLNLACHIIINILSTMLLSASNYCMQCLSAPTREEVDRAHARRVWLNIGVLGFRNLFNIHWTRTSLWALLLLSSLPLHLMWVKLLLERIKISNSDSATIL